MSLARSLQPTCCHEHPGATQLAGVGLSPLRAPGALAARRVAAAVLRSGSRSHRRALAGISESCVVAPLTRHTPAAAARTIPRASPRGAGVRVGVVDLLEPGASTAGTSRHAPAVTLGRRQSTKTRHARPASPGDARCGSEAPSTARSICAALASTADGRHCHATSPSRASFRHGFTHLGCARLATQPSIRRRAPATCRLTASTTESSLSTPPNDLGLGVLVQRCRCAPSDLPPCGGRPAELSLARGRVTVSGADTHRDDRSPLWIYPSLLRLGHLMSPRWCQTRAGVRSSPAAVR